MNLSPNWADLPTVMSRKIVLLSYLMKETDRLKVCLENLPDILTDWRHETEQNASDVKRVLFARTDIVLSISGWDNEWTVTAKQVLEKGNRVVIDKIYINDRDLSIRTAPRWDWD